MNDKYLLGKVVDIEDPQKLGRVRCEIYGRTIGLKKETLPWYVPMCIKDNFDLPKIDEIVYVVLLDNDIHLGTWLFREHDDRFQDSITDDDYKSAKILIKRYLDDWEESGDLQAGLLTIYYTKTDGLVIQLKESKINIRRNGTIHLYSEALKKQIDIVKDQISFGKLNKSDQPVTLGDDNNTAHTKEIEYTKWHTDTIVKAFKELAEVASKNPYTAPLAPIWKKYAAQIDSESKSKEKDCKDWLPETLSELCSLDKKIKD